MTEPDLHFGASTVLGASETIAEARWLEELGFEYLSAGEHFMRGRPPGASHAALPLLGVAAGATERIRILSSVLLTPFYHPLVLAKLVTTLDIASGGRLTLGVGVGGEFPAEFESAGLNVTQRGRRSNECLAVMKSLWTEKQVTYQGQHFQLANASINPLPTQRPHPPIWIAGRRDAAMRRAVRYGDGWLPYFFNPDRYQESVTNIIELAKVEGRDLANFQWAFFPYISIYPTVKEASEVAAEALGGRYLYRGDFVSIVKDYCLLGPPQQCIQRLQEYINAGARHIIFSVACPQEDRARHIETIAREIIPGFKPAGRGTSG
jgi:probable F420-dependent oxidoreductase